MSRPNGPAQQENPCTVADGARRPKWLGPAGVAVAMQAQPPLGASEGQDQRNARTASNSPATNHAANTSRSVCTVASDAPLLMIWRSASLR
jgi:hypothetical protein